MRELLSVALPAVITMTSYTVMQFVDNLIVKELGPGAISAVGNGGVFAFIPGAALMGLLSVVNTFVAQNLGAGTVKNGAAYVWNGLYLNIILWLAIFVPAGLFIEDVFQATYALFGQDAPTGENLQRQVTYGSICMLGMIFNLSARTVGHFFYGVHRPAVVMVSAICGNIVNLTLCSIWVLGGIGLPGSEFLTASGERLWWDMGFASMDVKGAALSTVVGGLVEFIIPFALFLAPWINRQYATRAGWRPSWRHAKGILRLGWPASLMQGNELLGWYIFMAILVGAFNVVGQPPVHTEAGWIVLRYMHLSFMPAVGLSIALTSIVGKYVGAGDEHTAVRRIWLGLGLTTLYMSVCAACFVLFRDPLVRIFIDADQAPAVADEVARIGSVMLIVAAAFQFFDAVAISLAGALRGAGDTVWPGIVTIVLTWVVLVGGGYAMVVYVPQWESLGPWLGAAGYIVFLAIAFFWRFLTGGWKGKAVAGPRAKGAPEPEPPMDLELGVIPITGDLGAPDPPTRDPSDDTADRA
ncbi:MAG: MATE family efflux transporter [Phycisphaerales bacterium]